MLTEINEIIGAAKSAYETYQEEFRVAEQKRLERLYVAQRKRRQNERIPALREQLAAIGIACFEIADEFHRIGDIIFFVDHSRDVRGWALYAVTPDSDRWKQSYHISTLSDLGAFLAGEHIYQRPFAFPIPTGREPVPEDEASEVLRWIIDHDAPFASQHTEDYED